MAHFVDVFVDFDFFFCNENICLGSHLIFVERWVWISCEISWLVTSLEWRLVFFTQTLFIWFKVLLLLMRLIVDKFFLEILNFLISFLKRIIIKLKVRVVGSGDFGELLGRFGGRKGLTEILRLDSFQNTNLFIKNAIVHSFWMFRAFVFSYIIGRPPLNRLAIRFCIQNFMGALVGLLKSWVFIFGKVLPLFLDWVVFCLIRFNVKSWYQRFGLFWLF